jgi:hypothetical protein
MEDKRLPKIASKSSHNHHQLKRKIASKSSRNHHRLKRGWHEDDWSSLNYWGIMEDTIL